jgi:bacterial leucyl aminopeptidase
MRKIIRFSLFSIVGVCVLFISSMATGHPGQASNTIVPVLADLHLLKGIGVPIILQEPQINLGFAYLTPDAQTRLSLLAHRYGKCGGYEVVQDFNTSTVRNVSIRMNMLKERLRMDQQWSTGPINPIQIPMRPEIATAISQASKEQLMKWVNWLSAFPNRYNKAPEPNTHVVQLKGLIEQMRMRSKRQVIVNLIDHKQTKQKSLRVTLPGTSRADEVVIMGGHLDSISFDGDRAPGSDDNASGSANLLEALRILMAQKASARTIEIFWYAGEESGLLGSAEIAAEYKKIGRKVVGVLQLDMTLFPGDGPQVIASMTDFTSSWMRAILVALNTHYVNAKIIDDKCGYGCSDHASWYRQGYHTLMPFESSMRKMNGAIHSKNDIVSPKMNFDHSLIFTKYAIALAMELSQNTTLVPPSY